MAKTTRESKEGVAEHYVYGVGTGRGICSECARRNDGIVIKIRRPFRALIHICLDCLLDHALKLQGTQREVAEAQERIKGHHEKLEALKHTTTGFGRLSHTETVIKEGNNERVISEPVDDVQGAESPPPQENGRTGSGDDEDVAD